MRVMSSPTDQIVESVLELARQKDLSSDVAILCRAVLHLYKQTGQLKSDSLEAFEQIEQLDRRQGPGDE